MDTQWIRSQIEGIECVGWIRSGYAVDTQWIRSGYAVDTQWIRSQIEGMDCVDTQGIRSGYEVRLKV